MRLSWLLSAFAGLVTLLCCGPAGPKPGSTERDSETRSLSAPAPPYKVTISGDQGWRPVKLMAPAAGRALLVDARQATFVVANSRNPHPTPALDCNSGGLPVNPYPLRLQGGVGSAVDGGRFSGRVPQDSDWRATYCNSAAVLLEGVTGGRIEGVRIARVWDAIRVGRGSDDLRIADSWLSDVRDDAIENDFLASLSVTDSLIDGAFQILSMKPAKANDLPGAQREVVTLSGLVARIGDYPYRDSRRFGALAKSDPRSPRLRLTNSVVAISSGSDLTFNSYWSIGWAKLEQSSNNLLLWLSEDPIPSDLARPRQGFVILRGEAARTAWTRARSNWINCHPELIRLTNDPGSNARLCQRGTWGGFVSS